MSMRGSDNTTDVQRLRAAWGENLRHRRELLGYTKRELAAFVGVTEPSVHQYESGKVAPRDDVKFLLAGALGCRLGELFAWPETIQPFPTVDRVELGRKLG